MHQFPVHTELADGSISDNYYNRIKPRCSLPPVIGSNTSFIDNDNKTQTRSARPPHVRVSCCVYNIYQMIQLLTATNSMRNPHENHSQIVFDNGVRVGGFIIFIAGVGKTETWVET